MKNRGFTLFEVAIVICIIWILWTSLYIWTQPYFKRSRDTKRVTDVLGYKNILEAYNKNFDTYPSNNGSGGIMGQYGYCLTEVYLRPTVWALWNEGKFEALRGKDNSMIPKDLTRKVLAIPPCDDNSSFFYSRLNFDNYRQMAILATRLEIHTSSNYWTWADLIDDSKVHQIMNLQKWNVSMLATDSIFIGYSID
jgi:prepilin-type N-terminal cleavage/methylation domain-containing protein